MSNAVPNRVLIESHVHVSSTDLSDVNLRVMNFCVHAKRSIVLTVEILRTLFMYGSFTHGSAKGQFLVCNT